VLKLFKVLFSAFIVEGDLRKSRRSDGNCTHRSLRKNERFQ